MMNIERTDKTIQLDSEILFQLIQPAFARIRQVESFEPLCGGAMNTTYKFTVGAESYVLKIYQRGRQFAATEQALLDWITPNVATPKMIYANVEHEPWAYAIFEYVEGMFITEVMQQERTKLSEKLGTLLAQIHSFKFLQAGLLEHGDLSISTPFAKGSSPYLEATLDLLTSSKLVKERLGLQLAEKLLAFIEKNRGYFPIVGDDISLVHADFKPVNLLYNGKGEVLVLDWEFAHAGLGILDFGILLRHIKQLPLDLQRLEAAYIDSGGMLPDEWERSAMICDLVNIAFLLDNPSDRPELFAQLIDRVTAVMNTNNPSPFSE